MELCNKGHFDKEGKWHKCGLPVEHLDRRLVHVHTCGLPSMKLPMDVNGACRYGWIDPEELARVARGPDTAPPGAEGGQEPRAAEGRDKGDDEWPEDGPQEY
ncbi:MAG: hypothetical protein JRM79_04205 [Nitrososphaerota archaeon]|nr:hypothetical protein [Nitrososphaerota archaeon]MDG6937859.1 hypothetical protein [Nitrososphaerota archaeon]MDG6958830.1 hypothetical protein [Nitrososphaerota archaeon]MDG6962861.1 hypothetical protein [Nitrososphaerota archaeon]MDG6970372.1 hypothetical protein [Nitrososphaerota archaeon]